MRSCFPIRISTGGLVELQQPEHFVGDLGWAAMTLRGQARTHECSEKAALGSQRTLAPSDDP